MSEIQTEPADLDLIQQESEAQALPSQEKQFRIANRVRSKLNNLPDPTRPPLGYVPGKGFDAVFPFIKLPDLAPNLNGDWVQFGSPELEPNRLYYGDNLQVLRTLPSNSIDLIYIDPPFFSGAEYNVIWGDTNEVRTFSDIWEGGLDTYLIWLNARLWEMRRVLKDTGSIYVHCDWHASHYIKTEMDKVFGYENFLNNVVWLYGLGGSSSRYWPRKHDDLLWYAKRAESQYFLADRVPATSNRMAGETKKAPDFWDIPSLNNQARERIGYPTQKPEELISRIVVSSCPPDGLVADFFVGGGTTAAIAQRLGRRWIACDSSRVAVSVTLNRLVAVGEQVSGVKSNYGKLAGGGNLQTRMDLPSPDAQVPDIRVHYVGVYPMDRFAAVEQPVFNEFILKCLGAQADASENAITGWRSAREPLLVGPVHPDQSPESKDVQAFFDSCIKQLQPNVKLSARVVCWRVSPELEAYRRRLSDYARRNLEPRGVSLDLGFLFIDSEEFRERIRAKYPDADANEFLLRFTKEPIIGEIRATQLAARRYRFEAVDADSTNTGGYLVNCQWDFDYQRGHFSAERDHVLGRTKRGQTFVARLDAEYTFPAAGPRTVACRVQDNLGAETVKTVTIEVA